MAFGHLRNKFHGKKLVRNCKTMFIFERKRPKNAKKGKTITVFENYPCFIMKELWHFDDLVFLKA